MHHVGQLQPGAHNFGCAGEMSADVTGNGIGLRPMLLAAQQFGVVAGVDGDRAGSGAEAIGCAGIFTPVVIILLKTLQLLRITPGPAQTGNLPLCRNPLAGG